MQTMILRIGWTDDIIKNVCAKSEQLSHHKMGIVIVIVIHDNENG